MEKYGCKNLAGGGPRISTKHHSRRRKAIRLRRNKAKKNFTSKKWPPAARPSRLSSSRSAWVSFLVSWSASNGNCGRERHQKLLEISIQRETSRASNDQEPTGSLSLSFSLSPTTCISSSASAPAPAPAFSSPTTAYHAFIFFLPPLFRKTALRVPAAARVARSRWLDAVSAAPRDSATQTVGAIFGLFSFRRREEEETKLTLSLSLSLSFSFVPSLPVLSLPLFSRSLSLSLSLPPSTPSSRSATASWPRPSRPRPAG